MSKPFSVKKSESVVLLLVVWIGRGVGSSQSMNPQLVAIGMLVSSVSFVHDVAVVGKMLGSDVVVAEGGKVFESSIWKGTWG